MWGTQVGWVVPKGGSWQVKQNVGFHSGGRCFPLANRCVGQGMGGFIDQHICSLWGETEAGLALGQGLAESVICKHAWWLIF